MSYGQSTNTNEFSETYPGSSNTNGFVSSEHSSHSDIDSYKTETIGGEDSRRSGQTSSGLDFSTGTAGTTENWKPTATLAGGKATRDDEESGASKPGLGDKLRGTAETLTGKVTGNPELVERGQERKTRQPPVGDSWIAE